MTALAWPIVVLIGLALGYRVALRWLAAHATREALRKDFEEHRADCGRHRDMFLASFKVVDGRLGEVELAVKE